MIYRYLLVSGRCLTCVGDAVKRKHREAVKRKTRSLGRIEPYGLDARLLRSCRRAYEEAMPVLYRENHFVFTNLLGMGVFQRGGLGGGKGGSPYQSCSYSSFFAQEMTAYANGY